PDSGELEYRPNNKGWHRQWQHDFNIDLIFVRSIDYGGFDQFGTHTCVKIAEDQGGDRQAVNHVYQNQTRQRAINPDELGELHQCNKKTLIGDKKAKQNQGKNNFGAAKFQFRQKIAIDRPKKQRGASGWTSHHNPFVEFGGKLLPGSPDPAE